jgi:hypothetical protein
VAPGGGQASVARLSGCAQSFRSASSRNKPDDPIITRMSWLRDGFGSFRRIARRHHRRGHPGIARVISMWRTKVSVRLSRMSHLPSTQTVTAAWCSLGRTSLKRFSNRPSRHLPRGVRGRFDPRLPDSSGSVFLQGQGRAHSRAIAPQFQDHTRC